MNEKQELIEKNEELESELEATRGKMVEINSESDKHTSEYSEKLYSKDIFIEKLSNNSSIPNSNRWGTQAYEVDSKILGEHHKLLQEEGEWA